MIQSNQEYFSKEKINMLIEDSMKNIICGRRRSVISNQQLQSIAE